MSPTCTSILTSTASPTRTLGQQPRGMENMWTSSLPPTRGIPQLILQEVLYLYFWNLRLDGLHHRAGCQFRCFWSASHWLLMIPHCLLEMRPSLPFFNTTVLVLSHVWLFTTPRTVAHAPLSLGFSRQEYWSGLPVPPLGDLPNPGIEPAFPVSPALQADSLPTEPSGKPM